jgi:hypothetical protein
MDIPEQLTTTLTVEKLGAANAERGTQMINVFIPEIGIAKYSTTMFVPMAVAAGLNPDDVFTATISRGKLKNNKDGEWANEYYWDFGTRENDSEAPTPHRNLSPSRMTFEDAVKDVAAPRPTEDDRQLKIMLQHASSVVGPAYGDWCRLDTATRGTFSNYLKMIAMGATWYLKHVYMTTGYNPQPEPVEEVEEVEPNDPWDQAVDA